MKIVNNTKESPESAPTPVSKARAVLRELIETCNAPSRLVELCYWSAEPELLDTLHGYIGLPEEPRQALHAFFTMVADCAESVSVSVSGNGDVILSSPVIAQLMNSVEVSRSDASRTESSH